MKYKKIIKYIFLFAVISCFFFVSPVFSQTSTVDREFFDAEKLFFQKKYNFAREAFLLYLKRRPLSTNDMLYYYIGACYFQDKQYENAINYYKLAFDINDSYSYCNNIANSYYQLKNYDEALIWYRRSIDRIYSPYNVKINYNLYTKAIVFQNVVTNTIFIGSNTFFEEEVLTNNIENNIDLVNTNIDNNAIGLITNSISLTNDLNAISLTNDYTNNTNTNESKIFFEKLVFSATDIFTNIVTTNTFTNFDTFTNVTLSFEKNTNFYLDITGLQTNTLPTSPATVGTLRVGSNYIATNILIMTNVVSNGVLTSIKTNVATLDKYNTKALYYSAYLNMGHTYIALGELTNAAVSYEIFLTNVGGDYYQKESLDKVINIIRSPNTNIGFIPFTNNARITTNVDGSVTKESLGADFSYKRETIFTNGVKVIFNKNSLQSTKMYSNDYEITDTIYPYGKREIETLSKDKTRKIETYMPDNTKSINITLPNGDSYEYIEYADGSFINKKKLPKENTVIIERSDGSMFKNIKDGETLVYYNKSIDGSEIERTESAKGDIVTKTKRLDGTVLVKTQNKDGSYTIKANYTDGSISTATLDTNGINTTRIVFPDGRVEERVSKEGNEHKFTYNIKSDDGSVITKTINEDGSFSVITKKKDGTVIKDIVSEDLISEINMPDGSIIKRIVKSDGSRETETLHKDKSSVREVIDKDGVSTITSVDVSGTVTTVIKDTEGNIKTDKEDKDGNYFSSTVYKDGRVTSIEKHANGVTINIESDGKNTLTTATNSEGYVIEIKEVLGEKTQVNIFDSLHNPVSADIAEKLIKETGLNITIDMVENITETLENLNSGVDTINESTTSTNPPSMPAN